MMYVSKVILSHSGIRRTKNYVCTTRRTNSTIEKTKPGSKKHSILGSTVTRISCSGKVKGVPPRFKDSDKGLKNGTLCPSPSGGVTVVVAKHKSFPSNFFFSEIIFRKRGVGEKYFFYCVDPEGMKKLPSRPR